VRKREGESKKEKEKAKKRRERQKEKEGESYFLQHSEKFVLCNIGHWWLNFFHW
jgi:hypothetical protein